MDVQTLIFGIIIGMIVPPSIAGSIMVIDYIREKNLIRKRDKIITRQMQADIRRIPGRNNAAY